MTTTEKVSPLAESTDLSRLAGKYLTFKLGSEEYGVEVLRVQEIMKMVDVTRVPRTPAFVSGVINLRGKVVSVVDLRMKFGMKPTEVTDLTCIIVLQVPREDRTVIMGIMVDEVSEVQVINAGQIEDRPAGARVNTEFILGMAKSEKGVKILLDIQRILSEEDLNDVEAVSK